MTTHRVSTYSVKLIRDGSTSYVVPHIGERLSSAQHASAILAAYMIDADREWFVVALLNNKNVITGLHTCHVGCLTGSIVSPRDVFKFAIAGNAAKIMVAHNHPSGDSAPSREDRAITARLVEAGKLLDIIVVDHIIVSFDSNGKYDYYSFANNGHI